MPPLDVERAEVGGIPTFYSPDGPGSPVVGMTFRVGRADETAATAGISHLVEHLALPARAGQLVDFNGSIEVFVTSFYASGRRDDLRAFLTSTARLLATLPLDRLDVERKILLAEDATRGTGGVRLALKLRFGPNGVGLMGYDDYGLRRLAADDVEAWARTYFTRGNAALWMVGMEPDGLEVDLPDGARNAPPPPPRSLDDLTTPALYASGWDTGFCLSFLSRRSAATVLALDTLADALRDRLRYELGLSYSIAADSMPLTAEVTHLDLTADVADENAGEWLRAALEVIDELASNGCDETRLDVLKERFRRYDDDPAALTGLAAFCADQELLGRPFQSRAALAAEREAVTVADIAETVRALQDSLLVLGPEATPLPANLAEYPYTSSSRVEGSLHRPSGFASRLRRGQPQLVVGPEGLSLVRPDGSVVTARYASTVLLQRSGASRTLLTDDGFYIPVERADWTDGKRVLEQIDAAIPPELVVSDDPELETRRAQVARLASSTFKRTWLISEELELLPRLLEDGESLLALGAGSRGWRHGLLAVTDRRFRFLYGDGSKHLLTVERGPVPARVNGSKLEILVDDEWIAFTDIGPKGKAAELEQLIDGWGRSPPT